MMFFLEMQRNLKNTEKNLKIFRLRRANNIRIAISNESQKNTSEDGADTEHRMESLSPYSMTCLETFSIKNHHWESRE